MLQFAKREPSAVLFAMQLAGVLLYPFMEGSLSAVSLFSVFGIAVLGLVVLAVRERPRADLGRAAGSARRRRRCCC